MDCTNIEGDDQSSPTGTRDVVDSALGALDDVDGVDALPQPPLIQDPPCTGSELFLITFAWPASVSNSTISSRSRAHLSWAGGLGCVASDPCSQPSAAI